MTDYEQELLDDLDSSNDEQEELEQTDNPQEEEEDGDGDGDEDGSMDFNIQLQQLIESNSSNIINEFDKLDIETINDEDLIKLSKIYPLIPQLKQKIIQYSNEQELDYLELITSTTSTNSSFSSSSTSIYDNYGENSQEYKFILLINELSTIINNEIERFHTLIKLKYNLIFPELESLIINKIDYIKLIKIFKQDLSNIKSYESQMKLIIDNEKVLVIIMAALQQQVSTNTNSTISLLSNQIINKILIVIDIIEQLNDLLQLLSKFISDKLAKFAPNVSAIVGPITTSQLLIATGSLKNLALTPSCNIASLGIRDLSTKKKTTTPRNSNSKNVRQTGYIYHSELVKYIPIDIIRSVMRIISGKIVLAARIDLSKSNPNGELGETYKQEILTKIDKLLTPPQQSIDKSLPKPIEMKSKKRAGRKYQKLRAKFEMSELRKAQNKLQFGKQEDTIMNGLGEEIGLGMIKSGGGGGNGVSISSGRIRKLPTTTTTTKGAKSNLNLSKNMMNRLNEKKEINPIKAFDEFNLELFFKPEKTTNTTAKTNTNTNTNISADNNSNKLINSNKWLNGFTNKK